MNKPAMITYQNGKNCNVRYKAFASDAVPAWATNVQPYTEPETQHVLYWLMTNGEPSCAKFKEHELELAHRVRDMHIRQGMGFVTLITGEV